MDSWNSMSKSDMGFMRSMDAIVSKVQLDCIRYLRESPILIVTSDYSGQHKGSNFETYAIHITGLTGWNEWEKARLQLRSFFNVGRRKISFKGLSDSRKAHILPYFLSEADQLPGLCVVIAVPRSSRSLFCEKKKIDLNLPDLAQYSHYNPHTFEKFLRIIHFVSFFLAGISREGQDVFWFTDQDDIAANDRRVVELTNTWANVFSHYLQHDLRHIKCGTTRCDDGSLQIEDLASLPDLSAGALCEMLNLYLKKGVIPKNKLIIPVPQGLSPKSMRICNWLAYNRGKLDRLLYLIDEVPGMGKLNVKQLDIHLV